MQRTTTIMIAVLCLLACVMGQPGCSTSGDVEALSNRLEPLRVRRPNGDVASITFAEAMAYHHDHEDHDSHGAAADNSEAQHEDGLWIGVAIGYQAILHATGMLFHGEIHEAADFELSARGPMRGLWDIFDLHAGRQVVRPKAKQGTMSLEDFTFMAKRVSTGATLTFRLHENFIPPEFFELKNRGVTCDDDALSSLK